MEKLDFVKLAVSKEEARYNLCSVYRDSKCFVATDGNRLHIANGLEEVKPHYISGLDATFPEYNIIIPTKEAKHKLIVKIERETQKQLDAIEKLLATFDKDCGVRISVADCCLVLTATQQGLDLEFKIALMEAISATDIDCGMNLKYLNDVFRSASKFRVCPLVNINFWDNQHVWEFEIVALPAKAYIMPMRLR